MSDVQLTISKEIVNPIVEAKVKEAILAAMGGADQIVENAVKGILTQKVNSEGKVSNYSSDNKYSWIDIILTKQIKEYAEQAIKETLGKNSLVIKDELIKQLQSKKGSSIAAKALLDAMSGSFSKNWRSNINIELLQNED